MTTLPIVKAAIFFVGDEYIAFVAGTVD